MDDVEEAQASLRLPNPSNRKAKVSHPTNGAAAAASSLLAESMVDRPSGGSAAVSSSSSSSSSSCGCAPLSSARNPRLLKSTVLTSFFPPVPRAANIVNWRRRRDLASAREDARSRASQARQVASKLQILRQCFQQQDAELGLPHMAEYSTRSEYEMREVVSVRAMLRPGGPAFGFRFSSESEFRAFVSRTVVEEPRLQQCMSELDEVQSELWRAFVEAHP